MTHPFFLAGSWRQSSEPLNVTCPYDNSLVGQTWLAGDVEFEEATQAAVEAAEVRFHTLLTLGSGNRLGGLFAKLYVPIFTPAYAIPPNWTGTPAEVATWLQEHGALVDALAAGDAHRFLRLLKKHVHFQAGRTPEP